MYSELIKMLLNEKFKNADFDYLKVVSNSENNLGVAMSGDTFGIIQAISAAVLALQEESEIPTNQLIDFIQMGTTMLASGKGPEIDTDLLHYLEKCYNKPMKEE